MDGKSAESNVYVGVFTEACRNILLRKQTPYNLERLGNDMNLANTKANLSRERIKSLLLPREVLGDISNITAYHPNQNFDKSVLATTQVAFYLVHEVNPELAYITTEVIVNMTAMKETLPLEE